MLIENPKLRRAIVRLVGEIAPEHARTDPPLGMAISLYTGGANAI
jgi:hypothetical protein